MPYPKPHPPYPAPAQTAVNDLRNASIDDLELHYHKGLDHSASGRVILNDFIKLQQALSEHTPTLFQNINLKLGRRLVNPQAGLAADRETAEGWHFRLPKPPERNNKKDTTAAEMIELYWMALLRDTPFDQFLSNADVAAAANELSALKLYPIPQNANNPQYQPRQITPGTIFRGGDWASSVSSNKELLGPYISQFLLHPVRYGSLVLDQRERRRGAKDYPAAGPHLINFDKWLQVQNGEEAGDVPIDIDNNIIDKPGLATTGTFIHNMADLARYVHIDALYEAYLNAALILLEAFAPLDDDNPYLTTFTKEISFGTFGPPHVLSLVCEVATRALKAVWYQKWIGHLRLRPEAYGGLVHRALSGVRDPAEASAALGNGLAVLQNSNTGNGAVARIRQANQTLGEDTYLLPMVFPEGSPTHPAYGAGHATVAGACVTVLKAFFKENVKLVDLELIPKVPNPSAGYKELMNYTGSDAAQLTVGGELDKVASNVAIGRNMAGVHWRSDYSQSILLGQRVATSMLYHQRRDYHERPWSFTYTSFGGNEVWIGYRPNSNKEGVYLNGIRILDHDDDLDSFREARRLEMIV